jgi:hypothetical protein
VDLRRPHPAEIRRENCRTQAPRRRVGRRGDDLYVWGKLGRFRTTDVGLAFADRRLFAAVVLTIRGGFVTKVDAIADPAARAGV